MKNYSLFHLSDPELLHDLTGLVARDCANTAELLAHIAEVDARKLYLPAAYPSMFAYCLGEFGFSEDIAFKRIRAARAARKFPAIFAAIAEGRLHLTAVMLLKPYLKHENVNDLLDAAAHKTKAEIELLLAHRFPQADVPTRIRALAAAKQVVPEPVLAALKEAPPLVEAVEPVQAGMAPEAAERSEKVVLEPPPSPARVVPLAPRRFALRVTIDQDTRDKLRRAQELLSHQIPSGDVAEVLDRALDLLVHSLEKAKFAVTEKPRPQLRPTANERHIPAHVKRAVRMRDGDRCTYVSETGRRCEERKFLEFDHSLEVARGGRATVDSIRLRCRPHNQFTAEQTFGADFMEGKRQQARRVADGRCAMARPEAT